MQDRSFIRTLWGDESIPRSQTKIRHDVQRAVRREFFVESTTFVFGRANKIFLESLGVESILVDERPVLWPGVGMWRHKLEVWKLALQEFREIVYLDWDVRATAIVPNDFWGQCAKKAELQACLVQYRNLKALWRASDQRKVPSGGFVYVRDAVAVDEMIESSNARRRRTDEVCMAIYTDKVVGGWQGIETYYERFEPDVCRLGRKSALPSAWNEAKPANFLV